MKKIILSIAAVLVVAAAFTSCKSSPSIVPTFAVIEKTHHLPSTTGNFEVSYRFEYLATLADQAILEKVQRAMATDIFATAGGFAGVTSQVDASNGAGTGANIAEAAAAAFDASLPRLYGTRSDSSNFHWDGHLRLHSKASLVGSDIVAFTIHRSEDSGGAHGMEETLLSNYDLRNGARLKLDDLFTPEGKTALAAAIHAAILKDKGVATWDELMTRDCFNPQAEIAPTENFTLTADPTGVVSRITFIYNPYEIACYAAGATTVTLPLAGMAGFKAPSLAIVGKK